jgi:peptide-methionine (S)-S-oxide reductase
MTTPTPQSLVLGGGCFWCLEAAYQEIAGVTAVVSGYAGGRRPQPTYAEVSSGATGHAEVVRVTFDPAIISAATILQIFWALHDPTTPNRQGHDVGPQYRSLILYAGGEQRALAETSRDAAQALWPDPIVTQIEPLDQFWPAEQEHQNYFRANPERAYCQIVIDPKLARLRSEFKTRLKAR